MGIGENVKKWLIMKALGKAVKTIVGVVASAGILQQAGVSVDVTKLETWLLATAAGGITILLNYLKVKTAIGKKLL